MNVRAYRNLRKGCWSIVDSSTGKVVYHARNAHIKDVSFRVREAGRKRVIADQQKNVHAVVCGQLIDFDFSDRCLWSGGLVAYNPYKAGYFYDVHNGRAILEAKEVFLYSNGKAIARR